MWQNILSWAAGGGGLGLASLAVWALDRRFRDAIMAERRVAAAEQRRADDWRVYGQEREAESRVLREQLLHIVTRAATPNAPSPTG